MSYTMERSIRIYDDKTGEYIYVGPDADGLDLVELRDCDVKGVISHRFCVTVEQALLVAKAIQELYGPKD